MSRWLKIKVLLKGSILSNNFEKGNIAFQVIKVFVKDLGRLSLNFEFLIKKKKPLTFKTLYLQERYAFRYSCPFFWEKPLICSPRSICKKKKLLKKLLLAESFEF